MDQLALERVVMTIFSGVDLVGYLMMLISNNELTDSTRWKGIF